MHHPESIRRRSARRLGASRIVPGSIAKGWFLDLAWGQHAQSQLRVTARFWPGPVPATLTGMRLFLFAFVLTACDAAPGSNPDASPGGGGVAANNSRAQASVFTLIRQIEIGGTSISADAAKAEAALHRSEMLPQDTRQKFATADGEPCYQDAYNYPSSIGNEDLWPVGAGLDAGAVSFNVAGSPSAIVLEGLDLGPDYGTFYAHGETPPPLRDGSTVYSDFFESTYAPEGGEVLLSLAGGTDAGPQNLSPSIHVPTSPVLKGGLEDTGLGSVSVGPDGLRIQWETTSQEGTDIEVAVSSFDPFLSVRCRLEDDGAATLPLAALEPVLFTDAGLYISRRIKGSVSVITMDQPVTADVIARSDRFRRISLTQ